MSISAFVNLISISISYSGGYLFVMLGTNCEISFASTVKFESPMVNSFEIV